MRSLCVSKRRGEPAAAWLTAAGLAAAWIVGFGSMGDAMGMPMPAFMGVERVVIACRMSPEEGTALRCVDLAAQARAFLAEGLKARGRSGPPVVVVSPGDEALIDPAALVVTLHGVAAATADGKEQAAVAVEIRRPGQLSDGVPFFQTPPATGSGAPNDLRASIGRSLQASLAAGVIEPLTAAPWSR